MSSKWKRNRRGPAFVRIFEWMQTTPAWHALTPVERCAYIELKRRYNGTNNGRIGLACRDLADALGVSRNTANRALRTLERTGFIRQQTASAFSNKLRLATEWTLTEHRNDVTGALPTKDFMSKKTDHGPISAHHGSHPWDCGRVERG